jgi:hypothetical protein
MNEELVDYLAERCNLFVSELRLEENYSDIIPVVNDLAPSRFSAEEWSASLTYLFEEFLRFESSVSAKIFYMKSLSENRPDNKNT